MARPPQLGPADIPRPGVRTAVAPRAVPAFVQDDRGAALGSVSRDLNVVAGIGLNLYEKRRRAEDDVFVDTFHLEYGKRAAEVEAEALNSPEAGDPEFASILDDRLAKTQAEVLDELTTKSGRFKPSNEGRERATSLATGMRTTTARSAVQTAHNQRVSLLLSSAEENVQAIARSAAETGNLDGGLARIDEASATVSTFLAPDKARAFRDGARATAITMVVEGHLARGEFDQAQAIVDRETGFYRDERPTLVYPEAEGLLEKGNVDLNARPTVIEGDQVATLRSVSRNIDGVEVLVPTVTSDGRIVSDEEAFQIYARTGEHLGKFASAKAATAYAKRLSADQGRRYNPAPIERAIFDAAKERGVDPAVALAIAQIESGLDPKAKNPNSSAAGIFQITSGTGAGLGLPKDASTASLDAQSKAGVQLIASNAAILKRALGSEPTPAEIYLAHFLGPGDAIRVLRSDADTSLSEILTQQVITANPHLKGMTAANILAWSKKKMQGGMSAVGGSIAGRDIDPNAAGLPLDTAVSLSRRVASARGSQAANYRTLMADDEASIRATGEPLDVDFEKVRAALDEDDVTEWGERREDASTYWDSTHDMAGLPEDEITARVDALEPRPGEVGFARAESLHSDVAKEARRIVKLRSDDPALSVAELPEVKQVAQSFDQAKPTESWAALMRARIAAQERIGIADGLRTVLTNDEAKRIASPIRTATEIEWYNRFDQMVAGIEETFGDYADEALRQVVSEFVKNEDKALYAARIIGQVIDRQGGEASTAAALDGEIETDAMEDTADSLSGQSRDPIFEMLRGDPNFQAGQRIAIDEMVSGRTAMRPVPDETALQFLKEFPESLPDFVAIYGETQVPAELR